MGRKKKKIGFYLSYHRNGRVWHRIRYFDIISNVFVKIFPLPFSSVECKMYRKRTTDGLNGNYQWVINLRYKYFRKIGRYELVGVRE